MATTILVDADAFIALAKSDDSNHQKAQKQLKHLLAESVSFLTSNYVFSEVVTVLSQRVNHQAAVAFIETMRSTESLFTIRWIDSAIEERALEIFKKQTSKNVSFVDCTNMALMSYDYIDRIFSFDRIYNKNHIAVVRG